MRILSILLFISPVLAYAAPPKACDLMTPAQAQTVMGGKPSARQDDSGTKCGFSDPGQSKDITLSYIALSSLHLPQASMAVQMMKQGSGRQEVPGLGEYAYYEVNPGAYDVVALYHGYMIGLHYSDQGKSNPKDAMIAAVRQVLGKF